MTSDAALTVNIGKHVIHREETLLHVRWIGSPTLDEQRQIYDHIAKYLEERGIALLLFDLRQAGPLPLENREASANWWRNKPLDSIALAQYGLHKSTRFTISMIARAIRVLAKNEIVLEDFEDEANARLWLEAVAKELRPFRSNAAAAAAPKA